MRVPEARAAPAGHWMVLQESTERGTGISRSAHTRGSHQALGDSLSSFFAHTKRGGKGTRGEGDAPVKEDRRAIHFEEGEGGVVLSFLQLVEDRGESLRVFGQRSSHFNPFFK